jgi:hypothetical protein
MDKTNLTITILTIFLPIIGGIIGYFIKYYVDKRRELLTEVTKERRELYQHFVNLIIDVFSGTKTGKKQQDNLLLTKLFDFYKKYILYASSEVIIYFSDYFQYLYSGNGDTNTLDHSVHFKKLSKDTSINNISK